MNNCDLVRQVETKTDILNDDWFPEFVTIAAKSKPENSFEHGGVHGIALLVNKSIFKHVTVGT